MTVGSRWISTRWLAAALVVVAALVGAVVWRSRAAKPAPRPVTPAAEVAKARPGGVRIPDYAPVTAPRFAGANVVLISVDTERRDHLAPYGAKLDTAAASRLAREGVVFERAVSHVPLTLPSHSSIFTGLYPPHHGVHDNAGFVLGKDVTTLAERLREHGYQTGAVVGSYVVAARFGLGQGFETYDDSFDYSEIERRSLTEIERPAGQVVDRALDWLRRERRAERPSYLWVHLYDPHDPYNPPEEFRRRAPTPYAGEVLYADSQVARLLDALDAMGLRQRTLVYYVSDHGESLGEHGEATHGIFLYGSTLDVPMIIAPPSGASRGSAGLLPAGLRVRGLARLVDVTPTVLDLVGLPVPAGLDGMSLLPLIANETAHAPERTDVAPDGLGGPVSYAESYFARFHHGWSELVLLETERWRSIRAPHPELYDRRSDPKDLDNVYDRQRDVAATLTAQLESMNLLKAGEAPTPAKIDPQALERLQALGYVGAGSGAPAAKGAPADPKDKVPLLQELQRAQGLRDAGRLEEAAGILEDLSRKDPGCPEVPFSLALVYFGLKNYDAAIAADRRVLELNPNYAIAVLNLALAYQAAGRTDEAIASFHHTLELLPENVKALLSLAEIHYARGKRQTALEYYERAAKVVPQLALVQANIGTLAMEMSRLDLAETALREAERLGDSRPSLHYNLGVIAEERGDRASAAREYRAEVAAHPDAYKAWVNLGLLERQAGRSGAALEAFERAASTKLDEVAGPYLMAETLANLGRRPEAQRWAQEALRRGPSDPRVRQLAERLR
jgi:choline-sulfatase